MKKVQTTNTRGRWTVAIIILIILSIISLISSIVIGIFLSTAETDPYGNVAHIKILGPILTYTSSGFGSASGASSTEIVRLIEKADDNPEIKAILFEINSPGGTAVASYEIADAIAKTNKTTVAWIREGGTSGAYWAASACDYIIANPMSITGSIGVISSYIEFEGTLNRYNASYRRLVSGDYKDIGSPFKTMTEDEEQIMLQNLDAIRAVFVSAVADNRGLSLESVNEVADGRFYIGKQAFELGLVDDLGGKDEAVAWIENKESIEVELAVYARSKTLGEILFGVMSEHGYFMGIGMGESLGTLNNQDSIFMQT